MRVPSHPHFPIKPSHAFLAALAYLALNFVSAPLSILYGSALAAYLVWLARPEYLIALIILHLDKTNFILAGYGGWEYSVQRFFSNSLIIGGIPVTVTYVIAATVFLRVFWELFNRPETYRRSGLIWLFLPWIVGLAFATIMTLQAFLVRNPSWTLNIRLYMLLGCVFYGAILMRSWRGSGEWLVKWLVPLLSVMYFFAIFGRFHQQFLWVFTGMAIPLSWLAFRQKSKWLKFVGVFCGCAVFVYASGLGPGITSIGEGQGSASGILGTGSSTFTLNALLLFSIVVAIIVALPKQNVRSFFAFFLGVPAFLTIITFTFTVALLSPKYSQIGSAGWNVSQSEMTVVERFRSKLFDDRSIIWHGMLRDLMSKDPLFRPAGSPVIIEHPRHGSLVWTPGAHNAFLEIFRAHRWVGGSIVILFIFVVMIQCAKVIDRPLPSSLQATAAGIIAVSIIANTAGHNVVSGEGSFWYFTFAGIIIAASAEIKHRNQGGGRQLRKTD